MRQGCGREESKQAQRKSLQSTPQGGISVMIASREQSLTAQRGYSPSQISNDGISHTISMNIGPEHLRQCYNDANERFSRREGRRVSQKPACTHMPISAGGVR